MKRLPELNQIVIMGWTALTVVDVDASGFTSRCAMTGREFWSAGLGYPAHEIVEHVQLQEAA